jgi:membrane protein implicated in regulation of membrane protease activity
MTRFFRESILGILLLSIAGSLLASWLAPYFPSPTAEGTRTFFFQPIPVAVLFPYSIALVMVFAVLTKRWQEREQQRTDAELADVRAALCGDPNAL